MFNLEEEEDLEIFLSKTMREAILKTKKLFPGHFEWLQKALKEVDKSKEIMYNTQE